MSKVKKVQVGDTVRIVENPTQYWLEGHEGDTFVVTEVRERNPGNSPFYPASGTHNYFVMGEENPYDFGVWDHNFEKVES